MAGKNTIMKGNFRQEIIKLCDSMDDELLEASYHYVISCIQDSSNPQGYNISDGIPFVVSGKHVPLSHGSVSAIKYSNCGIKDTID